MMLRLASRLLPVLVVLVLVPGATHADYYATKADYRLGKLTPGDPPGAAGGGIRAGGDRCASPTDITVCPFSDTGDTTNASDDISSIPLACNGSYSTVAGPDHIYSFTPTAGFAASFQISTSDDDYDPSIYVLSDCSDGQSCVTGAASDNCFAVNTGGNPCGPNSTEAFGPISFTPGAEFFFFVDSFYAPGNPSGRDSGPYTLHLTGPGFSCVPVELLHFSVD